MSEQVFAHLNEHTDAHHMTLILDIIVEEHTHNVEKQQGHAEQHDKTVALVGDKVVEHIAGDDGIAHGYDGHEKGCQHIKGKDFFVGLVVAQKSLQHSVSSSVQ